MDTKQFEGHTPGPWKANAILNGRIVGGSASERFDKIQINNHNATVATVYRGADVELIAQAPDLLADNIALRAALRELLGQSKTSFAGLDPLNPDTIDRGKVIHLNPETYTRLRTLAGLDSRGGMDGGE